MSAAMACDNRSWPDHDVFVSVVAFEGLCVPVRDLLRAIDFYAELFAMRVVAGGIDAGRVVLSRAGRTRIALYRHRSPRAVPVTRITATVESLEKARETVWDLGITTLRDIGGARTSESSFVIADPDGHEIHFIERQNDEGRRSRQ